MVEQEIEGLKAALEAERKRSMHHARNAVRLRKCIVAMLHALGDDEAFRDIIKEAWAELRKDGWDGQPMTGPEIGVIEFYADGLSDGGQRAREFLASIGMHTGSEETHAEAA